MFRPKRFTLRGLLLAFALIAVLAWLIFSSGLMSRKRLYLISHLGTLEQEKRSVRYGIIAYTEHLLLPGRRNIVAVVLVRPNDELPWKADGRIASATFDSFDFELINGTPHIVLQNMRVPFHRSGDIHSLTMTKHGVPLLHAIQRSDHSFTFDEAMMFLQTARADQWNVTEFENWMESPESAGITRFPNPIQLVPADSSKTRR